MSYHWMIGVVAGVSLIFGLQMMLLLILLTSIDNTLQDMLEQFQGNSKGEND